MCSKASQKFFLQHNKAQFAAFLAVLRILYLPFKGRSEGQAVFPINLHPAGALTNFRWNSWADPAKHCYKPQSHHCCTRHPALHLPSPPCYQPVPAAWLWYTVLCVGSPVSCRLSSTLFPHSKTGGRLQAELQTFL